MELSRKSRNIRKIEKDKKIWLSASVFGFPVAKGVITPDKVQYYVKINKTYFDGDFSEIQKIFGVPLDFTMLQNLLLGDRLFEMKAKKRNLTLQFDKIYEFPVFVKGDIEKIEQVLINLIVNSIKYGKPNGTTIVGVENYNDTKFIIKML